MVTSLIAALLSGCTKKDQVGDIEMKAGDSALYIKEDGSLIYGICEAFDKEYYNEDDLDELINSEIKDFNDSEDASSEEAAKIKYFKVKDKKATAVFDFETINDFISYAKVYNGDEADDIFIGKIQEAVDSDYKINGQFNKVDKNTVTQDSITEAQAKELDDNMIIVNDKMKIQLENGAIEYVSQNCKIENDIISVTDDETAYIIYK